MVCDGPVRGYDALTPARRNRRNGEFLSHFFAHAFVWAQSGGYDGRRGAGLHSPLRSADPRSMCAGVAPG